MTNNNIVEICLFIEFDNHVIQSNLQLPVLKQKLIELMVDCNIEVEHAEIARYNEFIPDTRFCTLVFCYSGTTLRPYDEARYQQVISKHLNSLPELSDAGRTIPSEDIAIRVTHKMYAE